MFGSRNLNYSCTTPFNDIFDRLIINNNIKFINQLIIPKILNIKLFWIINLFGIQLMPTILVFFGCLSIYPAVSTGTAQFNTLDILGILITLGAIILETAADNQLHKFRGEESNRDKVNNMGLWAYSRHPNYFGEICFWWGLFIFGLSADSTFWWTIIGPISITLLFLFISIPIMEKHNTKNRSIYAEYKKNVSVLIPWKRKLNEKN